MRLLCIQSVYTTYLLHCSALSKLRFQNWFFSNYLHGSEYLFPIMTLFLPHNLTRMLWIIIFFPIVVFEHAGSAFLSVRCRRLFMQILVIKPFCKSLNEIEYQHVSLYSFYDYDVSIFPFPKHGTFDLLSGRHLFSCFVSAIFYTLPSSQYFSIKHIGNMSTYVIIRELLPSKLCDRC